MHFYFSRQLHFSVNVLAVRPCREDGLWFCLSICLSACFYTSCISCSACTQTHMHTQPPQHTPPQHQIDLHKHNRPSPCYTHTNLQHALMCVTGTICLLTRALSTHTFPIPAHQNWHSAALFHFLHGKLFIIQKRNIFRGTLFIYTFITTSIFQKTIVSGEIQSWKMMLHHSNR